jgi:hypothetical protein
MHALQYDGMRLVNFRVPNHLRVKFNMLCQCNQSTMTKELTRFMSSYITQELPKVEQMGVSVSPNDMPTLPTSNRHRFQRGMMDGVRHQKNRQRRLRGG